MARYTNIRQGQIYWLQDCPPLDGLKEDDHPVIVIDRPENLVKNGIVRVVVCPTHPTTLDVIKFSMPIRSVDPQTGLHKPCWALPRWYINVNRFRLTNLVGKCPTQLLIQIITAVHEQIEADES